MVVFTCRAIDMMISASFVLASGGFNTNEIELCDTGIVVHDMKG